MKKKEITRGIVVISAVALLSGYLLSQVFEVTKPRIDEQKKIEADRLNKEIFPEGVSFAEVDEKDLSYTAVYDADKNPIGRIYQIRPSGYGGAIAVRVGFDNDFKVKGVRILEHNETPGLGAKIKDAPFLDQFKGKSGNELYLKKYNKEGTLDAVTGATISSKAVSDGIRKLQEKLNPVVLPSSSGDEGENEENKEGL